MDARHFDALAKVLSAGASRRWLLALLVTMPMMGGLLGILSPEETEAAGRRKRRKKAHKHGKGRRRKHHKKKKCTPDSTAQTCANTCGSVTNNCQQTVNCGSCACAAPCDVCFTCQDGPNTPGTCVVDADQVGDACGSAGQVCQADGTCICVPDCERKCGGISDGCGGTCPGPCAEGRICLSNGTCAVPCTGSQTACVDAGCSANRCITTDQGGVCGATGLTGSCSTNAQCPVGTACISAVTCENVC